MRTKISLTAKATFSPAGEGRGPLPLPFWGMYLPEGPPGACVCLCALPLPALSQPPLPQRTPGLPVFRLPPPHLHPILAPGLSVSSSLSSWPALGEGQIFTALRLTQDRTGVQKTGVSLRVTKARGKAGSSSRRRVWGEGVSGVSPVYAVIWTSCIVLSDAYL